MTLHGCFLFTKATVHFYSCLREVTHGEDQPSLSPSSNTTSEGILLASPIATY